MKKRIMVAATGLSAGTLVAMSVVNPKVVSGLVRVDLVKADNENLHTEEIVMQKAILHKDSIELDLESVIGKERNIRRNVEVGIMNSYGKVTELYSIDYQHTKVISISGIMGKSEMTKEGSTEIYSGVLIVNLCEDKGFDVDITIKQEYRIEKTKNYQIKEHDAVVIKVGDPFSLDMLVEYAKDELGAGISHKLTYAMGSAEVNPLIAGEYNIKVILGNDGFSCTVVVKENDDVKEPSKPTIKAKIVNLNYGEEWSNELGLEYARDSDDKPIPIEELHIVDGNKVNPFKPGTYEVKYYYKEGSDVFDTSIVTVGEKKTDTSETDTDDENTGSGAGGNTTSNIKEIDTTNIMTDKELLDIYDENGIKTGEKSLSDQTTDFVTKEENEVGGNKYYSIGNNEWVMAKDVRVFNFSDSNVQTHGDSFKGLTKLNSGAVTDRGLEKTTDWYTDRTAYFENELHHRVATHEWVHDDHVVKYQSVSGLVHTDDTAQLYSSQGEKWTDRALAKNAIFFTDKKATINGKLMYRVATDEWVDADTVTFK